jgi:hypothetical protein
MLCGQPHASTSRDLDALPPCRHFELPVGSMKYHLVRQDFSLLGSHMILLRSVEVFLSLEYTRALQHCITMQLVEICTRSGTVLLFSMWTGAVNDGQRETSAECWSPAGMKGSPGSAECAQRMLLGNGSTNHRHQLHNT